ncbi:MAG: hypothetical protein M1817_000154 [Caeruleum heppii]|nr:MAG: hypothetical protein M1817_000154 [Caeruleum heppii]
MDGLSSELIRDILDHIGADPERTVSIDRRAYLSVESFAAPSLPAPAQAQDIAHFRLVCKRFAELGIPHQFTRVTTRFSKRGFCRLERIAGHRHITKHVKKFSYMVPCFYVEGRERVAELFQTFHGDLQSLDAGHFQRKAQEQRELVESGRDLEALKQAISAFDSLQHVQILRLQDEPDRLLWEYIRENHDFASNLVQLKWMPACVHGTRTIGEALLEARSSFTRFSGPMMNPQSALVLQANPSHKVSSLASRLTCLELHFDEGFDLDNRMRELSGLFQTVFTAATGMLAVHVGFPSRAPLGLRLEEIFHNVRWEKLRAFGIQAWRLDADEIVALARRHRRTLRGLRLRDVLLKEGSTWKTVLSMLRDEFELLDWVSLRRIGYTQSFDEQYAGTMEVPPDPPGGGSESDDEDGFPTHLSTEGETDDVSTSGDGSEMAGAADGHTSDDDISSGSGVDDDDDDGDEDENNDHGPSANELAMQDPGTPSSVPWCSCNASRDGHVYALTAEELRDNGRTVDISQRKMWERWVVGRRCRRDEGN